MWTEEKPCLLPLPEHDLACCVTREVALNPYCQVVFETNRYSLPADKAYPQLTLRAFPFVVEVLHGDEVLARHARCYDREQDIIDPLHYLPLLVQRPGAFEHAQPIRRWRSEWPPAYEQLLKRLQQRFAHHAAIRQFVQVLNLNRDYDAMLVEQAVAEALKLNCGHFEGVQWCLNQQVHPSPIPGSLDLSTRPHLAAIGQQPLDLSRYDHLLKGGPHGD
jgi:hypothetical protein